MSKFFLIVLSLIVSVVLAQSAYAGTLSCSVTTAALCTGGTNTIMYRMSNTTNAHAELSSGTNYTGSVVCCSGITGLSNSCAAPFDTILRLSGNTNAHAEKNSQAHYANNVCLSVPIGGTASVSYVADPTTCVGAGYDTTIGTISADTNAHVGDTTAYVNKICGTASAPATGLPATGTLTSSVYDTTAISTPAGYNSIMWKGTVGTGKVGFQLAASNSSTGPWTYLGGSTCGALDWFDTTGPDSPVELKGQACEASWNNKRYYRYKVRVCSASDCVSVGATSPIINGITVNWAP